MMFTAVLGKKMKMWERRLMKDFQVAPIAAEEELDTLLHEPPPENEDMLSKFRRVAKLAVLSSTSQKWSEVINSACQAYVSLYLHYIYKFYTEVVNSYSISKTSPNNPFPCFPHPLDHVVTPRPF